MEIEGRSSNSKPFSKQKLSFHSTKLITITFFFFVLLILFHTQASLFDISGNLLRKWQGVVIDPNDISNSPNNEPDSFISRLKDSITFFPLKDLRFAQTAMEGHTWFMSSLNDTYEKNEAEHLYFPSQASKGRVLCLKGRDKKDGTKNSYALAWKEALPDSATLMEGLTFISDTYYDYENLWHGLTAIAPFVGWSIKNGCLKPTRWVLFHWGELRTKMGSWVHNVMEANYGEVGVEGFVKGDGGGPYCFEKAVVMRHNEGSMGKERKFEVFGLLRCKARGYCGVNPGGRGREVNEKGEPIIRLTLLMRRGSRSFKNVSAVTDIFSRECGRVEGCLLKVAQSEDLSFCDQVRLLTNTDIVASPHGAQLTNMLFMDRNSSVMEFFPKGWLEHAGIGQYAHHWMADQSGMKHEGAWWDPHGDKECPTPNQDVQCFNFYKDGKVGHNETYFAEWTRTVLNRVRTSKLEQVGKTPSRKPNLCSC